MTNFKLTISAAAFNEIAAKLQQVLRDEAIIFEADRSVTLNMDGLALVKQKSELLAGLE